MKNQIIYILKLNYNFFSFKYSNESKIHYIIFSFKLSLFFVAFILFNKLLNIKINIIFDVSFILIFLLINYCFIFFII